MNLDEVSYSNYHSFQTRDAENLLTEKLSKLQWDREEGVVMDLGCGPGDTTLQLILPFFKNATKLVAIDLPNMIAFAKRNHSHPKIEYEVADIDDRKTLEKWQGKISKLVSIQVMHWAKNQKDAFKNVYNVLKPGGEAAFVFILKTPYRELYRNMAEDTKWNTYIKEVNIHIPESHYRSNNSEYYKEMLEEIGFTIIILEETDEIRTFESEQQCKDTVCALFVGLLLIPEEHREDFKSEVLQRYISMNGRGSDGMPHVRIALLKLVIKKIIEL